VVARGEWSGIRPLDAIVSYPVLRADGSILASSGYDAQTRTLAQMAIQVGVSDTPTVDDAIAAVATLRELVRDFPFTNDAAFAAWLASLLTVVARPAIDGPTPMLLLDASTKGSGKTLLADVIATIATGNAAPRRTAPETAEEWRKVIMAMLLAGDPIALIDNVTRMLVSAALDAMLTGTTYKDRILGASEERAVPVRTVVIASANNCRLSSDLVRRTITCRLEPNEERPEQRSGFAQTDLLGHVRREREMYLSAALTIVRAYAVADRPTVNARSMGSYTSWCRVVRDALVWAGVGDPATTQDELRESADVERDELRELLTAWHGLLGDRAVTLAELLEAARTGRAPVASGKPLSKYAVPVGSDTDLMLALRGVTPDAATPSAHTLGNRLRSLRGQIAEGLRLVDAGDAHGKRRWRVVQL
jgi:hypothetical protein